MRAPSKLARVARTIAAGALVGGFSVVAVQSAFISGAAADSQPYYGWGFNGYGQLGVGNDTGPTVCAATGDPCSQTPTAVLLPGGAPEAVASGYLSGYAITATGQLDAWGYNVDGELGDGNYTESDSPTAVSLPGGVQPVAVAAGFLDGYAIGNNNVLYAWGDNSSGQLGNGSHAANSDTPVTVTLPDSATAVAIAGSADNAYAIGSDGNLYAWGDNTSGQLGDGSVGTGTSSNVPVKVSLLGGFTPTSVAAGNGFALAMDSNTGAVEAWGDNSIGELGNGSNVANSGTPVSVSLSSSATAIGAGFDDAYAIAGSTPTLYAWGDNTDGALGNGSDPGTVPDSNTPVAVSLPVGADPTSVTGGSDTGYAVGAGGTLYAWGNGTDGALGNGTQGSDSITPITVTLPEGVSAGGIAAGLDDAYAIDAPKGSPIITSPDAVTFNTSEPNSFTVTATGDPTPNFFATGVPPGLTFTDNDNGTATLAGIPACSASGTYLITIEATNGSPRIPALQTLTVTLNNPVVVPPVFNSADTDTITAGKPMTPFPVLTSCNPGMTITAAGLPSGLKLSKVSLSHYTLMGTPKANVGGVLNPATFTAKGMYGGTAYTITQSFTLTVNEKPVFETKAGDTVVAGNTLSFTVVTLAYPPLTSFTSNNTTRAWMTFTQDPSNPNQGTLTGTTSGIGGKFAQTFLATNAIGSTKQLFTLVVDEPPAAPTGPVSRTVLHGKMMASAQFHSAGYPTVHYAYTVVSAPNALTLPTGIVFSPTYGKFSGTPAAGTQGTYVINVVGENTFGSPATLYTSPSTTFTLTVT